jgi:hypothetical protein
MQIGLAFSDQLRMDTINSGNISIRKHGSGAALAAHYSYWLNMVNISAATPFETGTQYDIVIDSGVRDLAGNAGPNVTYTFTTAGSPPVGGGAKITGLVVYDTANQAGWSTQTNFQAGSGGAHPWSDYAATYVASLDSGISGALAGKEWVRVKAASKAYTGGPQARITLGATSDVYMIVDDRWGTTPSWTSGWTNTGYNVAVWESSSKPALPFSVFKKAGVSGSVDVPKIGANTAYNVFIVVN